MAQTAIVLAARHGDRALFDDYRRHFETTRIPAERELYLVGLGSFRNPQLMEEALHYALTAPLRPQEFLMIPTSMAINSDGDGRGANSDMPDLVFQWLTEHYAEVAERVPPQFSARILRLAQSCSSARLETTRAFFAEPEHHVQNGDREMERMSESIRECDGLHERESKRVENFFFSQASQP
jgi:alanyl aminopeptidase